MKARETPRRAAGRAGDGRQRPAGDDRGAGRRGRPASRHRYLNLLPAAALVAAAALTPVAANVAWAPPAVAAGGQCTYPAKPYEGTPWSLKRLLLDQLWENTRGKGVKVAVIDTGVDDDHPQLKDAVADKLGKTYLNNETDDKKKKDDKYRRERKYKENGTMDLVGHGTKAAGIIAARPSDKTGFVGLAPQSTIIPIQQNDAKGTGTSETLAKAIGYAVEAGADVINISQDTAQALKPDSKLETAVNKAVGKGVVIVASAGNEGYGGNVKKTYPASYENVIAVAASNRNNERAAFSQSGKFVDIAAPGVDMITTVPGGGHCAANGTSFAAPFVSGVVALLVAEHPNWEPHQIAAQIEQTAERSIPGRDKHVGWGVIDPVRALTEDDKPIDQPSPREGVEAAEPPAPAKLELGETTQERNERLGTYTVISGIVLVTVLAGSAVVYRDWRRRREPAAPEAR